MNELVVRSQTDLAKPVQNNSDVNAMASGHKAAIILSILDPADANEILKGFAEETLLKFAKSISSLRPVPGNVVIKVVDEFLTALGKETM